jgi:hypothetical protein
MVDIVLLRQHEVGDSTELGLAPDYAFFRSKLGVGRMQAE